MVSQTTCPAIDAEGKAVILEEDAVSGSINHRNPGPLGQSKVPPSGVRSNWLCVDKCLGVMEYWNVEDPPLEGWNSGFIRMRSLLD